MTSTGAKLLPMVREEGELPAQCRLVTLPFDCCRDWYCDDAVVGGVIGQRGAACTLHRSGVTAGLGVVLVGRLAAGEQRAGVGPVPHHPASASSKAASGALLCSRHV